MANLEGSETVLVVDDETFMLSLADAMLERYGYSVLTATSAQEVLHMFEIWPDLKVDVAVFDVVMPHISGPELVRYMRTEKRFNKIPVMMMTAEQDPKLSADSFAAGAVVFLPKPFTTIQLQTMLRMLVGKAVSQG